MMLAKLVEYAEREGLGDLDFHARVVDYELRLADDGAFVGLVALGEKKRRASLSRLPLGEGRSSPGRPYFVVDNAQYLFGVAEEGGEEAEGRGDVLRDLRHARGGRRARNRTMPGSSRWNGFSRESEGDRARRRCVVGAGREGR